MGIFIAILISGKICYLESLILSYALFVPTLKTQTNGLNKGFVVYSYLMFSFLICYCGKDIYLEIEWALVFIPSLSKLNLLKLPVLFLT